MFVHLIMVEVQQVHRWRKRFPSWFPRETFTLKPPAPVKTKPLQFQQTTRTNLDLLGSVEAARLPSILLKCAAFMRGLIFPFFHDPVISIAEFN